MLQKKSAYRITLVMIVMAAVLIASGAVSVSARDDTMALDDVQPGMSGSGRTVFSGVDIDEFDFEVIDVLRDFEPGLDLILIYLSGERIEESGGVASGMSGSPIYVDDQIIGAISYGWAASDNRYALATPIEPMLDLLDDGEEVEDAGVEELPGISTPLVASGLSGRRLEKLEDEMEDYFHSDFEVIPSGEEPRLEPDEYPELEPGSAISVQLARGDVSIASIGTLTYREGNNIVAMGHPFTHRGDVNFLLGQAHISSIIPGDMPFKLGSPLPQPVGMVSQDRGAGLGGGLDFFPRVVPLRVAVEDEDREVSTSKDVQIVKDEELLQSLPTLISLQVLDASLDRIGSGTAETELSIMANELEGVVLTRDNMFYSQSDIAARSLRDLQDLMDIINFNPFMDADLFDIELEVTVRDEDRVALIQEAEIDEDGEEIHPGEEIDLNVMLRPYRQEPLEKQISLEIPEDISPGPASLSIFGGATGQHYAEPAEEFEDTLSASFEGYTDLEPMLEDFVNSPRNNDLVMEIYPGYPGVQHWEPEEEEPEEEEEEPEEERPEPEEPDEPEEPEEEVEEMPPEEPEERIREIEETDYVLEGSLYIDFTVTERNSRTDEEDDHNDNDR